MWVASFIGFSADAISSAVEMSISLSLQSPPHLLTCGDRSTAQMAGCCPMNRSIMSSTLFHRVTTSVLSLCAGNCRIFCFSCSSWFVMVLQWKKPVIRLILPSSRDTVVSFRARWAARMSMGKTWNVCQVVNLCSGKHIGSIISHNHQIRDGQPPFISNGVKHCIDIHGRVAFMHHTSLQNTGFEQPRITYIVSCECHKRMGCSWCPCITC